MGEDWLDWTSFWDLASPEEVAESLATLYGRGAAGAAADCALAAHSDGRKEDHSFWCAVFCCIARTGRRRSVGASL